MTIYEPLRNVDPWLASLEVWSLPTPVDVLAWVAVQMLRAVAWVVVTPTLNVATRGDLWPPVYWSAIGGFLWLAGWGSAGGMKTWAHGEDVSALGSSRSSWLGFAAGVIRLQVKVKAQAQAAAAVVGYGGASVLFVVGVLWWWLVPLVAAAVAVVWQTQVRQRWWIDS